MAFCASCGAEVQGKFCAQCGKSSGKSSEASAAGDAPPFSDPASASAAPAAAPAKADLEENIAAALCYLLFVLSGIFFLVLEPYSRNKVIRFHAFQSILFWASLLVLGIVLTNVIYAIVAVPLIGWLIYILVWVGFWLGFVGLWLYLMYKAYNKERFVLPVIGELAEKLARS